MRRLNIQDSAFLTVESDESPTHVAGLQIYQLPPRYKGNFFQEMFAKVDLNAMPEPPFNLKLGGSLSKFELMPRWVEDDEFDIDYHLRFVRLPAPGSMEQLTRFVSRLHGQRLDRKHPLWECYCIEGIEGNRVAMYIKVHHALVDGMAAMAILTSVLSNSPRHKMDKPFWQVPRGRPPAPVADPGNGSLVSMATEMLTHGYEGVTTATRSVRELGGAFLRGGFHVLSGDKREAPLPFASPKSMFNVPICRHRRFGAATLSLSRIKEMGKNLDATVNDIVLAICAGTLRKYLEKHNALPKEALTALCPVSVRPKDAAAEGNAISMIITTLGTQIPDPLQRLEAIKVSSRAAKESVGGFSREAATNYALLINSAVLATNAIGLSNTVPPPGNLVISNVPGPRTPLYMNGAQLIAGYPLSVLVHGQALNITVTSYMDSIDFGLLADREVVPDVEDMAQMVYETADELEAAFEKKLELQAFQAAEALAHRKRLKEAKAAADAKKKQPKKKAAKKKAATKSKAKKAAAKKASAKKKTAAKKAAPKPAEQAEAKAAPQPESPVPPPPGETYSNAAE